MYNNKKAEEKSRGEKGDVMFRLKEIRTECGIKRSKMAADLKINAGTIANYENEIRQAPYEYLIKFADYFDVSIDYLLGRGEEEKPLRPESAMTGEEAKLLADFRLLDRLGKSRVCEYVELWKEKE